MTNEGLKIRVEELNAVAEHVPPAVLGKRILAAIEEGIGGVEAINIWARFDEMPDAAENERGAEIRKRLQEALESAERLAAHRLEEIGRLEDTLREERIAREERPSPEPVFDPGIPAGAEDRAMPETPEPRPERTVPEASKIRAFHASGDAEQAAPAENPEETVPEPEASAPEPAPEIQPAEDTKVCKRCEEEKPLSAYSKHTSFKDGLDNRCRECRSEMRLEKIGRSKEKAEPSPKAEGLVGITNEASEATEDVEDRHESRLKADATKEAEEEKIREFAATRITVLPPAARVPEPEEIRGTGRPKAPARFCSNGDECISTAQIGRPTKLTHGNKERRCFACQEAEIGEKPQEKMIVRHSAAD